MNARFVNIDIKYLFTKKILRDYLSENRLDKIKQISIKLNRDGAPE